MQLLNIDSHQVDIFNEQETARVKITIWMLVKLSLNTRSNENLEEMTLIPVETGDELSLNIALICFLQRRCR